MNRTVVGLSRAPTSSQSHRKQGVGGRDKPGHDELAISRDRNTITSKAAKPLA